MDKIKRVKEMKKYEYLIKNDLDAFDFPETEMNKLGEDGWALIGIKTVGNKTTYFFKRESLTSP